MGTIRVMDEDLMLPLELNEDLRGLPLEQPPAGLYVSVMNQVKQEPRVLPVVKPSKATVMLDLLVSLIFTVMLAVGWRWIQQPGVMISLQRWEFFIRRMDISSLVWGGVALTAALLAASIIFPPRWLMEWWGKNNSQ